MNNELERIYEETMPASVYALPRYSLGKAEANQEISQDYGFPDQDSNRAPLKYKAGGSDAWATLLGYTTGFTTG